MSPMRASVVLICLLSLMPVASHAQCPDATPYTYFDLWDIASPYPCSIDVPGGTYIFVNVVAITNPIRSVTITVPDPPAGELIGETWNYPHTGDRINGMTLNLGCQQQGTIYLGTIVVFFPVHPGYDLPWQVGADSQVADCNFNSQLVEVLPSMINSPLQCFQHCTGLAPHSLYPEDGATGVPLNGEVSWLGGSDSHFDECSVRIYTSPDCSTVQVVTFPCDITGPIIALGPLQPSTTYYWQVSWFSTGGGCSRGGGGMSPIQSFTTQGALAAQPATWGRVKLMYRE